MSFQAITWAIEQRAGNPSAKSTLWSIANYANEYWCSYPKQETIAKDSEQSVDSVGKRVADLIDLGLLRRIKLKRFGRRTHDFLILAPSPLFAAEEATIGPHLPAGCEIMADQVATPDAETEASADCGSAPLEKTVLEAHDPPPPAAADCGSVENEAAPATLPQSAVDATALVRQLEPVLNQESPPNPPSAPGETASEESGSANKEGALALEPIGFATFMSEYPFGQMEHRAKARAAFVELDDNDRGKALYAAPLYARDIRSTKRKPVAAWRFLKERRFASYAPGAARTASGRVFVPEASEAWNAWCAVAALAFGGGLKIPTFWAGRGPHGERGANCPAAWPLGGEGWLVPLDQWIFVARDTAQFHRWNERVHEILGRPIMSSGGARARLDGCRLIARGGIDWATAGDIVGARVPMEWPPAKGAPASLTDEDHHALANL